MNWAMKSCLLIVKFQRRAHLHQFTVTQCDNPIGHSHSLDLVVGDINHGITEPLVESLDLCAHLDAHFGVKIGQGFVEQEHLRIAND